MNATQKPKTGVTQIGGKGTMRRTFKVVSSGAAVQDKSTIQILKALGVKPSNPIETVNMFYKNGTILHYRKPTVQANTTTKCFVILGKGQVKRFHELIPDILTQMDFNDLATLRARSEELQGLHLASGGAANAASNDDDDIPELVESFEDVDV